jgi:hypothetical protein
MATYERPGGTRRNRVTVFNPAADILRGIEYVEDKFVARRDKVNLFQQQADERYYNMQQSVNDIKKIDEEDFSVGMRQEFMNMVDNVYKADIASFDGDRTDYMRESRNAQKVIGDFQAIMGQIDAENEEYKNKSPEELKKTVLRTSFMGDNGEKRMEYLDFVNDPSKMGIRIENGNLIVTNKGKDLFNGTEYLNSRKDGFGLVNYADDYTEQIDSAAEDASKGIAGLEEVTITEKLISSGRFNEISTTQKNNYAKAIAAYRNNLENSDKVNALLNESTFQRFVKGGSVYNSEGDSNELTKSAMIDYLVSKKFPSTTTTPKTTIKLEKKPVVRGKGKKKEKPVKLDFSETKSLLNTFNDRKGKLPQLLKNPGRVGTRESIKLNFEKSKKETSDAIKKSLEKFKNAEISVGKGRANQQITGFNVDYTDEGFKIKPFTTLRDNQGQPKRVYATAEYLVNLAEDLQALEQDLIQGGTKPKYKSRVK